jgi:PAS domain S-box-containing protein
MGNTVTTPDSGLENHSRLESKDALRVVETVDETTIQDRIRLEPCTAQKPELIMFSDAEPLGNRIAATPDPWADLRFQANLVMALPDAAIATDADYNVRLTNPAAEELYDFVAADVVGTPVMNLIRLSEDPAEDRKLKKANEKVLLSNGFWSGRVRHLAANGEHVDIDASATVLRDETEAMRGVLFLSRDVTPLRRAERAAQERTEFADAVLESLPGRTCVIDAHGTVVAVNHRYRNEGPAGAGEATGPALGDDYLAWLVDTMDEDAGKDFGELLSENVGLPNRIRNGQAAQALLTNYSRFRCRPEKPEPSSHVDITARKQPIGATRRATHDPLTGLPNRVLLADRLAHALPGCSNQDPGWLAVLRPRRIPQCEQHLRPPRGRSLAGDDRQATACRLPFVGHCCAGQRR